MRHPSGDEFVRAPGTPANDGTQFVEAVDGAFMERLCPMVVEAFVVEAFIAVVCRAFETAFEPAGTAAGRHGHDVVDIALLGRLIAAGRVLSVEFVVRDVPVDGPERAGERARVVESGRQLEVAVGQTIVVLVG